MEKAKVIVTGDSKQIDLLIRESKVKIARGLLAFEQAGLREKDVPKDTKDTKVLKVPKDTKTIEQK
jgi:predicted nucleic acid-binding protein